MKKKKVICAMSGGVDSSVSAAILNKKGYNVTGVFMKCWQAELANSPAKLGWDTKPCSAEEDEMWARRAAAKIGIPFYSVDLVGEYKDRVFDYFIAEYKAGRTPNPDVMCNREIKFGVFYDWAINEFGADYIATGHYARLRQGSLFKGKDPNKDQSYFLWAVPREKFEKVLFPVGNFLKSEVRAMANKFGLPNAARADSQGVCFVGEFPMGFFLQNYIADRPGLVINAKGENIGEHRGLHFYTIGQRRGINIGGGLPYYVARKDFANNALVVSREYDDELFREKITASSANWISPSIVFHRPFKCKAKLRYRQQDQDAIIEREDNSENLFIKFIQPQRAVTPGQSIVFYRGDALLGGAIIDG